MEKVFFKNSKNLNIVGILYPSKNGKIVICVHGISGEKTEYGRFSSLAKELGKIGYGTLLFDLSGHGESADTLISIQGMTDDLNAAINYCLELKYKDINLLGFSFGGIPALNSYKINFSKLNKLILWSPATESYVGVSLGEKYITEKEDFFSRPVDYPERELIYFSKDFFNENSKIKKEELLSIDRPILIIHGENDENIPANNSKEALKYLPKGSKLVIIKDGNHTLDGKMEEVIKNTLDWLEI